MELLLFLYANYPQQLRVNQCVTVVELEGTIVTMNDHDYIIQMIIERERDKCIYTHNTCISLCVRREGAREREREGEGEREIYR